MKPEVNKPAAGNAREEKDARLACAMAEASTYQNVAKSAPSAIYVCDVHTHELLYLNDTCRAMIGAGTQEPCGRKCYEVLMRRDSPCPFCSMEQMTDDSFHVRSFTNPLNGSTYLMKGRRIRWRGADAHIEYVMDDTDRTCAVQILQKKLREQECIAACSRPLSGELDFTDSLAHILEEIGTYYGAQRCVLLEVDKNLGTVRKLGRWTSTPMDDYPQSVEFRLTEYPALIQRIETTECHTIKNVEKFRERDPKLYAFLSGMKIENLRSASCELDETRQAYIGVFNSDMADPDSSLLGRIAFYIQHRDQSGEKLFVIINQTFHVTSRIQCGELR